MSLKHLSGVNMANWQISQLFCRPVYGPHENVVSNIRWRRWLEQNDRIVDICGSTDLPTQSNGAFIPFEQLTPSIVEGWLEAELGSTILQEIDATLLQKLEAELNPVIVAPELPWS